MFLAANTVDARVKSQSAAAYRLTTGAISLSTDAFTMSATLNSMCASVENLVAAGVRLFTRCNRVCVVGIKVSADDIVMRFHVNDMKPATVVDRPLVTPSLL